MLAKRFRRLDEFRRQETAGYKLLPLRFIALDNTRSVLTNMAGEYLVVGRAEVNALIRHALPSGTPLYDELCVFR
jgi:hypothetical protein